MSETEKAEEREAFKRLVKKVERKPRLSESWNQWVEHTGFDVGRDQ